MQGKPLDGSKNPGGRPPWKPSAKQKIEIATFSRVGYSAEFIADYLDIKVDTLMKHCGDIITYATPRLLSMAVNALASGLAKREGWAVKFVLATKGKKLGWTPTLALTGANGGPMQMLKLDAEKLKAMSSDELAILERVLGKLGGSAGNGEGGTALAGSAESFARALNAPED